MSDIVTSTFWLCNNVNKQTSAVCHSTVIRRRRRRRSFIFESQRQITANERGCNFDSMRRRRCRRLQQHLSFLSLPSSSLKLLSFLFQTSLRIFKKKKKDPRKIKSESENRTMVVIATQADDTIDHRLLYYVCDFFVVLFWPSLLPF